MTVKDKMLSSEDELIEGIVVFSLKMLLDNRSLSILDKNQDAIIEKLKDNCKLWLNTELEK